VKRPCGSSVGLAALEGDSGVAPSMLRRPIIRPICRPSALAPLVERRSEPPALLYALLVRQRSARRRRRGMCSQRSSLQIELQSSLSCCCLQAYTTGERLRVSRNAGHLNALWAVHAEVDILRLVGGGWCASLEDGAFFLASLGSPLWQECAPCRTVRRPVPCIVLIKRARDTQDAHCRRG
jgi:hypothetical protein